MLLSRVCFTIVHRLQLSGGAALNLVVRHVEGAFVARMALDRSCMGKSCCIGRASRFRRAAGTWAEGAGSRSSLVMTGASVGVV